HAGAGRAIDPQPGTQTVGRTAVADAFDAVAEWIVAAPGLRRRQRLRGQSVAAEERQPLAIAGVLLVADPVARRVVPLRREQAADQCGRKQAHAVHLALAQQQATNLRQVARADAQSALWREQR